MSEPTPIVIMASGQGSLFAEIAKAASDGRLEVDIRALIVSRMDCGAAERARGLGVPVIVFDPKAFPSAAAWDQQLAQALLTLDPRWVVLAGFMQKIGPAVLQGFDKRIVNTHPSLLPKFGGRGMYGMRVHEAVISAKEKESGISVHIVTEGYDEGPIIAQTRLPVLPDDTPTTLAERIKAAEREFYVAALKKLISTPN